MSSHFWLFFPEVMARFMGAANRMALTFATQKGLPLKATRDLYDYCIILASNSTTFLHK